MFLDIPVGDTLGHFLKNVKLEKIDENSFNIKPGDKNIFIIEYEFKSGAWCGLSTCVSPHTEAFNYWIRNKDWGFIIESGGVVVETDKDYVIVEKYFKEDGVWNETEIEYIYADPDGMKILDFDVTKIK